MTQKTSAGAVAESNWVRRLCLPHTHRRKVGTPEEEKILLPAAIDYAEKHGLVSLLLKGLSAVDSSISPIQFLHQKRACPWIDAESEKRLREGYLATLRANLGKLSALKEINNAFRGMKKPCVLWKGAALIQSVYSDPALRPMDDIDILVFKENLSRVRDGLTDLGFRPLPLYPMTWQNRGIFIDLHLDVMHSDRIASRKHFFPLSIDEMEQGLERLWNMENLAVPKPHDMLLLCAVHALKHDFCRDIWVADGLYILHRHPELIDHQGRLLQRARQFNAQLPMDILLCRMQDWQHDFGIDTAVYRHKLHTGPITRMLARKLRKGRHLPGSGELLTALMIPSAGKRLRFFLETAFPSKTVRKQLFTNRDSGSRWKFFPRRIASLSRMLWKLLKTAR